MWENELLWVSVEFREIGFLNFFQGNFFGSEVNMSFDIILQKFCILRLWKVKRGRSRQLILH